MTNPRPSGTEPATSVEAALHGARMALHCLYLAVDSGIADDVKARVEAAFATLRSDRNLVAALIAQLSSKYEQVVWHLSESRQNAQRVAQENVRLAADIASLREDALTPEEAKICRIYVGEPFADEHALCEKLQRIASRLTAGSPEQERTDE